jgi:branched-subunit amino acid transport protein
MGTLWLAVVLVAAISAVTKALGPVALGGRRLPGPARAVIALLAPALLAALVVVDVAGPRWSDLDWTIPAGLLAAVLARLALRAPDLLAILAGVVVTALLRLLS